MCHLNSEDRIHNGLHVLVLLKLCASCSMFKALDWFCKSAVDCAMLNT